MEGTTHPHEGAQYSKCRTADHLQAGKQTRAISHTNSHGEIHLLFGIHESEHTQAYATAGRR